jgi:adenine-specific DNA-methyltransferase
VLEVEYGPEGIGASTCQRRELIIGCVRHELFWIKFGSSVGIALEKLIKNKNTRKKSDYHLINDDCFTYLKKMEDDSVDLTITSPPYFMGKEYDRSLKVEDFIADHKKLFPEIIRVTKPGGSICWQVGYHVLNGVLTPLDAIIYDILRGEKRLQLRNRIVWTYGHGLHGQRRFSGRHETILWYTKADEDGEYFFDLDSVRVPQKYPGKTYYHGNRKGEFSGNPNGKNPSDVWEIPNVKANHVEKTEHPCQFPVALVQRLIRALTPKRGFVFDPFMGSGSSGVAALLEHRNFIGCELKDEYHAIAKDRCSSAKRGNAQVRPLEKPVLVPTEAMSVARIPPHFNLR